MRIAMPGYMPFPNETVTLTSHCARCKNIDGEQNNAKLMLTNMRLVYEWSSKTRMGDELSCLSYPLTSWRLRKMRFERIAKLQIMKQASNSTQPGRKSPSFSVARRKTRAVRWLPHGWTQSIWR